MAFRRTLAPRLISISRISHQNLTNCRIPPSSAHRITRYPDKDAMDPGDDSILRRFLRRLPLYKSSASVPELRSPMELIEKFGGMDIARDRIRLDGLMRPVTEEETPEGKLAAEDVRKLLKVMQVEMVKSKLMKMEKLSISYMEYIEICVDGCWSEDQGMEFAKMLDESGTVIVLGSVVFLRPHQVMKVINDLMLSHMDDPSRLKKELEEMEQEKSIIDKKSESMVRGELWCGLGYLVVQTALFIRLTFWELSWDVMEPICFYVTSMAAYVFFLGTSKEPSFEGLFQSRFRVRQKKLMKFNNFDIQKYNELRQALYPRENTVSYTPNSQRFGHN